MEMAEGKPPYGDIHPMRAIFMIPTKPPPSFKNPDNWSPEFIDFVSRCLVKAPEDRATAAELLQHDFIQAARPPSILSQMITDAREIRESQHGGYLDMIGRRIDDDYDNQTMVQNAGTLVPSRGGGEETSVDDDGVNDADRTLVRDHVGKAGGMRGEHVYENVPVVRQGGGGGGRNGVSEEVDSTMRHQSVVDEVESDLGTMVINEDDDDEESTMKSESRTQLKYFFEQCEFNACFSSIETKFFNKHEIINIFARWKIWFIAE